MTWNRDKQSIELESHRMDVPLSCTLSPTPNNEYCSFNSDSTYIKRSSSALAHYNDSKALHIIDINML